MMQQSNRQKLDTSSGAIKKLQIHKHTDKDVNTSKKMSTIIKDLKVNSKFYSDYSTPIIRDTQGNNKYFAQTKYSSDVQFNKSLSEVDKLEPLPNRTWTRRNSEESHYTPLGSLPHYMWVRNNRGQSNDSPPSDNPLNYEWRVDTSEPTNNQTSQSVKESLHPPNNSIKFSNTAKSQCEDTRGALSNVRINHEVKYSNIQRSQSQLGNNSENPTIDSKDKPKIFGIVKMLAMLSSDGKFYTVINLSKDQSPKPDISFSVGTLLCFTKDRFKTVIYATVACVDESVIKEVIIEEANEIPEADLVVCLSKDCSHLILIGNYQPGGSKTGLSLMDRLVRNGVKSNTLSVQHRSPPEMCRLLMPTIYGKPEGYCITTEHNRVQGMCNNVFFVKHNKPEKVVQTGTLLSYENVHEAQFLLALFRYLTLQGYSSQHITILTPFLGQWMYLQNVLSKSPNKKVQVKMVNDFEGKENSLILLSLVRSNGNGKIDEMKNEKLVCTMLSRAKKGLYIIGDIDTLAKCSPVWFKIQNTLVKEEAIGYGINLVRFAGNRALNSSRV
uniref:DNA2/NAM7 helicase-like C-terminal domain-containing protein n=1 Tax=Timema tahoe TaxID=61484 RepID=A0A7R9IQB9_9NEOP|nr:unnamed protein product [Timema tahoe]